jgi:hypothetical protein
MMEDQAVESIAMPERKGPLEALPHADHATRLFHSKIHSNYLIFNKQFLSQSANVVALIRRSIRDNCFCSV